MVLFTLCSPRSAPEAIFQWVLEQRAPGEPCPAVQLAPLQPLCGAGVCGQLNPHGFIGTTLQSPGEGETPRLGQGTHGDLPRWGLTPPAPLPVPGSPAHSPAEQGPPPAQRSPLPAPRGRPSAGRPACLCAWPGGQRRSL